MNPTPVLLLDTNVFIEAAKRYYAFDIVPGFWDMLIAKAKDGHILSIDRVKEELLRGRDELSKWANGQFHSHFASTKDQAVLDVYREIIQWAYNQPQFEEGAKKDFARADNADAWLVAYAKAKRCVVVTEEKFNPDIKRKIPIPNVCQAFGMCYVDTFEMLRQVGVSFR